MGASRCGKPRKSQECDNCTDIFVLAPVSCWLHHSGAKTADCRLKPGTSVHCCMESTQLQGSAQPGTSRKSQERTTIARRFSCSLPCPVGSTTAVYKRKPQTSNRSILHGIHRICRPNQEEPGMHDNCQLHGDLHASSRLLLILPCKNGRLQVETTN